MGKYKSTGKWAYSKNLAEIMASRGEGVRPMRVKKKKSKNFGDYYDVEGFVI